MEHISVRQAADRWGISMRRVQVLCEQGRIPGAVRLSRAWMIPAHAQKPADPRREPTRESVLMAETLPLLTVVSAPMPSGNPDAILSSTGDARVQRHFEGALAYLRGDFQNTMDCFRRTEGDTVARGCLGSLAIPAAAALGDYDAFMEVERHYKTLIQSGKNEVFSRLNELCLALAAICAAAPALIPEWLQAGDFASLPPVMLPEAFQRRAKYLLHAGRAEAALAVAESALALCPPEQGITFPGIYLRLSCAAACHALKQPEACKRHLLEAMRICLPHGFISPFAESITDCGGLVEECLLQAYPERYDAVITLWERTIKKWIWFHNRFTMENITSLLTMKECHIALLAAQKISCKKIAEQLGLSVPSVRRTVQHIYAKLYVTERSELAKLVLTVKK